VIKCKKCGTEYFVCVEKNRHYYTKNKKIAKVLEIYSDYFIFKVLDSNEIQIGSTRTNKQLVTEVCRAGDKWRSLRSIHDTFILDSMYGENMWSCHQNFADEVGFAVAEEDLIKSHKKITKLPSFWHLRRAVNEDYLCAKCQTYFVDTLKQKEKLNNSDICALYRDENK